MARKIEVELVGNERNLVGAFNRTSSASGRLERNLGRLGHMTKLAIGTGVGVGIVGLGLAMHASLKEFEQAQAATAQTNAVIKSTGGVAGVTAKHVDRLSNSLLKKTGIDDEVIQSGENMLLTFRHIRNETGKNNDIFDQATKIGLDMSTALKGAGFEGGSLQTTMIRLGKALNDPITGMTALRRVGVTFTKSQQATIKRLEETGHHLEAQKLILGELRAEFGGSAAAYGKTLPGQLMIFKESLRNVGAYVVAKFIPLMTDGMKVIERFGSFIGRIAHAKNIKVGVEIATSGIKSFGERVRKELSDAIFGSTSEASGFGAQFPKAFHDGLIQRLTKMDWKPIGAAISSGFVLSADALNHVLDSMLSWASSHAAQFAAIGTDVGLRMIANILDPGFWSHHLGLAVVVMTTAFGGAITRGAGRFGAIILERLGPVFERALGEAALLGMRGVARLPALLGDAIAAASPVVARAIRLLWREIIGQTGRGAAAAGQEAGRLATFMGRALRLGVVIVAFRAGMSEMVSLARSAGSGIAHGISSALGAAGRAAHAFAGAMTSAMHAVLAPVHAVISAVQTLWGWLQRVKDFTIHIHIPVPHVPHISLPHIGKPGFLPATGGIIPMVPGAMRGRDSVPALLTPGEMVLNRQQQNALGGQAALSRMFGFGKPLERFARGGVAGKRKHRAPHLPDSIRLAEARAAGTPGLGDDIAAYSRELAWVNRELSSHDLTSSERASMKVRRVRVENRIKSLRRRQSTARGRDYSQLPAGLQLAISQARLAVAQAVGNQQIVQANARLRAALWNAKHWLDRQLNKNLSASQRAAVIDAITSIVEEINGITDPTGDDAAGDNSADLQAQLDQARAQAAAAQEAARLANDFVATGVFGGGGGGGGGALRLPGGGGQTIIFQHLIPDADQIRRATGLVAQGASMQPYRSTSVVSSEF